jgi:hypothetical protein
MKRSILFLFLLFHPSVFANYGESDILDKREVQNILFGKGFSFFDGSNSFYRAELIGTMKSVSMAAYFVKKIEDYLKTLWGVSYGDNMDVDKFLSLKGALFLSWERYALQPNLGIDAGWVVHPEKNRNLFSHAMIGLDYKIDENFGLSAREKWAFPNDPFPRRQPLRFKMRNAQFEVILSWQI